MNEKYIAQIEAQLEQIVEGAFTNLFRKRLNAHDIAMTLARAMENTLRYAQDGDSRPIAPDAYTIRLNSSSEQKLLQNRLETYSQREILLFHQYIRVGHGHGLLSAYSHLCY